MMNVYDFDNTILRGDSTARFYAYCFTHYPGLWKDIPAQALNGLLFALKIRKKQVFKQRMLAFLTRIGDVDVAVFSNENLGMNTLVHGRMMDGKNQLPITCKLRGWCDYKAGDHIQVQFEKRHFFDKETTNAIR